MERSREISLEILTRFRSAETPARRETVLRKFDLWYTLDEETSCELYSFDSRASCPEVGLRAKSNAVYVRGFCS